MKEADPSMPTSSMKRREDIFLKVSPISKDQYRRHVIERCVVRLRNNREMYLSRLRQGGEDDLRACAQDLFEGELQRQDEGLGNVPTSDLMTVECDGDNRAELRTFNNLDDESALFTEEFLIQLMEEISSELGPSWHQQSDFSADHYRAVERKYGSAGRDSLSTAAGTLGDAADFEDSDFFPCADPGEEANFADGQDDFLLCIFCRRCPMEPVSVGDGSVCMEPRDVSSVSAMAAYQCPACAARLSSPSSLCLFDIRDRFADVLWRHREHCTIPVAAESDLALVFEPRMQVQAGARASLTAAAASGLGRAPEATLEASCEVCLFRCDIYL